MLKKLIKHEFEATRKGFLFLYGIALVLCLLFKPLFYIRLGKIPDAIDIYASDILFGYALMLIVGIISTMGTILSAVRFYQSMTCDEAYLTFTLPATSTQILWSKVLVGYIWNVGLIIICLLSVFLTFIGTPMVRELAPYMMEEWQLSGFTMQETIAYVVYFGSCILVGNFVAMWFLMSAIAIGQLFGKYRLIGTIGTYLVFQTVISSLIGIIMLATGVIGVSVESASETVGVVMNSQQKDIWMFIIQYAYYVIFGGVTGFISHYIFKKKLNLE